MSRAWWAVWALTEIVSCALSNSAPYSYSLTTFDPNGRLQQIEFAQKAVERGLPAVAILVPNEGIVLVACSRRENGVAEACTHASRVTDRIVVAFAGMRSDFRALLSRAQRLAIEHERQYGVEITVAELASELAAVMQEHTQRAGVRPFGCALLLAGCCDEETESEGGGLELHRVDPSGWSAPWTVAAVGTDAASLQEKLAAGLAGVDCDVRAAAELCRSLPELSADDAQRTDITILRPGREIQFHADWTDALDHLDPPSQPR